MVVVVVVFAAILGVVVVVSLFFAGTTSVHKVIGAVCGSSPHNATKFYTTHTHNDTAPHTDTNTLINCTLKLFAANSQA